MSLVYLVLFFVLVEVAQRILNHIERISHFLFRKVLFGQERSYFSTIFASVSLEFKNKLKALLKLSKASEVEIPNMKLIISLGRKFC